ncbi:MAG TPA: HEAT repeat domain-containing protein [Pirellulales bacterium]|nr:HEAT repeat domain-containing protein [Pirellulales bacterium]
MKRQRWLTMALAVAGSLTTIPLQAADDVASLAKGLTSGSAQERVEAADELADLGPKAKAAAPALLKAAKDEDARVRGHAAHALGQVGDKSEAVVNGLFALATDSDALVRRAAIRALKALRLPRKLTMPKMVKALKSAEPADAAAILASIAEAGEEALPFLIECLDDKEAGYWACLALGDMGPAAKDAVPKLIKLEQSGEPQVRLQALVALGQIGPAAQAAIPLMVKALQADKTPGVRYAAAFALGQIGTSDKQARAALTEGTDGDDAFLQVVSAWALTRVAKDDKKLSEKATKVLIEGLKSEKPEVRRAAARGLAEANPPPELVAPVLIKAIQDNDPSVIGNAIDALASLGPKIVPRLANNALKNKDLRPYAVRVLAKIGPEAREAASALADALQDAEGDFRSEVQFVLGMFGPAAAPAAPELIKSLTSDEDSIRASAIYALGKIGPAAKAAEPELRKLLASDDEFASFAAMWALVRINPKDAKLVATAVPQLIKALSDERPVLRIESASTLGELGAAAKAALPELKKLAADADPAVSAAAKRAIDEISRGKP